MNEIGLRTYLQQIVSMVQDERYEEAILHARHILRHYPKYLAVYRVLGEIYLSNRRFPEAADLFQRVLSAVPDDFLAHFGMATIREEEGNLDAAIWHMERAFEAQPTHVAIQEELRRLYRERDGVAPPRIRFTRVALARIYLHSGLFNQSIVELQAVLQQDPRRLDALALLAQAYYEAGQWVQAADTCNRLLQKLPYCLQANRIMANILRQQGQEEKAQHYWSRVLELDPYEAFVGPEYPSADKVPADKVQVPRLEMEYTSDLEALPSPDEAEVPMLEELEAVARNTGLLDEEDAGPPEDEIFALREEEGEEEAGPYVPPEQAESLIPEWMQKSGWAPRDPSVPLDAAPAPPLPEDEEEEAEAELVEGEIPEWLQQLRAQAEEAPAAEAEEETPEAEGEPDWLPEAEAPTTALDDLATWLESTTPAAGEAVPPVSGEASGAAEDDWLLQALAEQEAGAGETTPGPAEAEAAELPDWLALEPEAGSEEQGAEVEGRGEAMPRPEEAAAEAAELPDWLALEPEAGVEGRGEAMPRPEEAEAEAAELPDWLALEQEVGSEEQGAEVEGGGEAVPRPEKAEAEAAELPDWLAGAAVEAEAAETALVEPLTADAEQGEAMPGPEAEAAAEAPAAEGDIPAALLSDEDAALAWLEQLAAKQGARTEELLTFREQAEAEQEAGSGEQEAEEAVPRPEKAEAEAAELPDWLALEQEAGSGEPEAGVEGRGEAMPRPEEAAAEAKLPDWLAGAAAETEAAETALVEPPTTEAEQGEAMPGPEAEVTAEAPAAGGDIPAELLSDEDAALAWLEQLAAKQGARTEELLTFREQAEAEPEAGSEEQGAEEAVPGPEAAEAAELPDWLAGAAAEAEAAETALVEPPTAEAEQGEAMPVPEAEAAAEAPAAEGDIPAELLSDEDAALAWLEQLAAKQGARTEELLTFREQAEAEPEAGSEEQGAEEAVPGPEAAEAAELPDWLAGAAVEAEAAETVLVEPLTAEAEQGEAMPGPEAEAAAETPAAEGDIPAELLSDEDAALAWLEQLAAKQGARTEELLTFREQAEAEPEAGSGEQEAEEAVPGPAEAEAAELPDWLALEQEAGSEEPEAGRGEAMPRPDEAAAEAAELPDWLAGAAAEAEAVETALVEPPTTEAEQGEAMPGPEAETAAEAPAAEGDIPAELLSDEDAALAWLEQLAAKQGARTEELLTFREQTEAEPEAGSREQGAEEAVPGPEAAEAEAAELPDWLALEQAAGSEEPEAGRGEAMPRPEEAAAAAEAPAAEADIPEVEALEDAIANLAWMEAQPDTTRERPRPEPSEAEVEWLLEPETWAAPPAEAEMPPAAPEPAPAEAEPVPHETLEWVQEVTASDEEAVEITPPAWVPTQHIPPPETMPLKPLPEVEDPYLDDLRRAREAIANYDLETGLRLYRRLIRRRKHLDAVIEDLLQAQYYYPMSVELLQLLGDAFSRAGRLQDALDTYLKAEELLR